MRQPPPATSASGRYAVESRPPMRSRYLRAARTNPVEEGQCTSNPVNWGNSGCECRQACNPAGSRHRFEQFLKGDAGQSNKRRVVFEVLPRRIPKAPKRSTRWRSMAHCNFVRSHQCAIADCDGMPIEVAHVRNGSGAGISQKPDDFRTVSLCRAHHAEQHRVGERTFWGDFDIEDLIEAFCKASPKAHEIARVKAERANG